jgi:hypothetical protein
MERVKLTYNSARENLEIAQYGRHIQALVRHATTIEDDELRQAHAERIVDLMHQISHQGRNASDYTNKLWRHLFIISDYQLKVQPPDGEIPQKEDRMKMPQKLDYPEKNLEFRHYGTYVKSLLNKAAKEEDKEKQLGFLSAIASYMKLAYRNWAEDPHINDDIIKADLRTLSNGIIEIPDDLYISSFYPTKPTSRRSSSHTGKRRNGGKSSMHKRSKRKRRN